MALNGVPVEKAAAESLLPRFAFVRLLNQDQAGRRVSLLGTIDSKPAILIAERAAFSSLAADLNGLAPSLQNIVNLGANDVYHWYLSSTKPGPAALPAPSGASHAETAPSNEAGEAVPNLKINLIFPCTEQHIAKYSAQGVRSVTETAQIYRDIVRPYMKQKREAGRLNWVFNILEGRTEQEDVIYRAPSTEETNKDEGFLLIPDLNWDRKTMGSLHLLGLVERRDIWSLRDLTKRHIPWLRHMRQKLVDAIIALYPQIDSDQLKLYVHYQPTYYHFHIHIVHVTLEAGATQAVGKALSLDNIISQLEHMSGEDAGIMDLDLTFTLGEASELWTEVFEPLKRKVQAVAP